MTTEDWVSCFFVLVLIVSLVLPWRGGRGTVWWDYQQRLKRQRREKR